MVGKNCQNVLTRWHKAEHKKEHYWPERWFKGAEIRGLSNSCWRGVASVGGGYSLGCLREISMSIGIRASFGEVLQEWSPQNDALLMIYAIRDAQNP